MLLQTNNLELEVITHKPEGQPRRPLLFVHGAWHAAWCWEEYFLPFFAKAGYAAHALSLRGHGKSSGSIEGSGLNEFLEDIEKVAATFEQPPVMVGHSLGGFYVLKYLEKKPLPGAILLASMPLDPFQGYTRIAGYLPAKISTIFMKNRLITGPRKPERVRESFFEGSVPPEKLESYISRLCPASMQSFMELLLVKKPDLEKVRRTPLLMLGNTRDPMKRFLFNQEITRQYGGEYQEIAGIGHDMMLDERWQAVAEAMLDWLAKLK
jgi:pimeloyl-ACP methyl ester carboxylesterase